MRKNRVDIIFTFTTLLVYLTLLLYVILGLTNPIIKTFFGNLIKNKQDIEFLAFIEHFNYATTGLIIVLTSLIFLLFVISMFPKYYATIKKLSWTLASSYTGAYFFYIMITSIDKQVPAFFFVVVLIFVWVMTIFMEKEYFKHIKGSKTFSIISSVLIMIILIDPLNVTISSLSQNPEYSSFTIGKFITDIFIIVLGSISVIFYITKYKKS